MIVNVCVASLLIPFRYTLEHVGKISQSATVRSLEANTVAAHYRQELT